MSKGSRRRPGSLRVYEEGWSRIFGYKGPRIVCGRGMPGENDSVIRGQFLGRTADSVTITNIEAKGRT